MVKCLADGGDPATTHAGQFGAGTPVPIGADDSIEEALAMMTKHQIRRLPVVDGHDLVGMLAQADIGRAMPEQATGDTVQGISQP